MKTTSCSFLEAALATTLIVLTPAAEANDAYPKTRAVLAREITAAMRQRNVVGLSIALVDDQRVVWAGGFGYADRARRIKAAPDTVYRAGSVSKLFTATAAMQLAEQGRFDIDAPLKTYLPAFFIRSRFPEAAPITPRLLMTHHAGLPSYFLKGGSTSADFSALAGELGEEFLAYPPNFLLDYSNLGFSLLGTAVQNACGQPFAACLRGRLLAPLGMADSGFSADLPAPERLAKSYRRGRAEADPPIRDVPAGGLTTTVLDLSRFIAMMQAGGRAGDAPLLAPAAVVELLRPQNAGMSLDLDTRIGLAWFLSKTSSGETLAGHSGSTDHYNSALYLLPDHRLGVAILSNSAESAALVEPLATAALEAMLAEKTGQTPTSAVPARPALPSMPEDFAGFYATDAGLLEIVHRPGRFLVRLQGRAIPLKRAANGSLQGRPAAGGEITLWRTRLSEREVLIQDSAAGRVLVGEKVAGSLLSPAWRQRLGNYQVENPDPALPPLRVRLLAKSGFLLARVRGAGGEPLERVLLPLNDRETIFAGLGRGLGETLRVEERAGAEVLGYSGYRLRRR